MIKCNFCNEETENGLINKFIIPDNFTTNTSNSYYLCLSCAIKVKRFFENNRLGTKGSALKSVVGSKSARSMQSEDEPNKSLDTSNSEGEINSGVVGNGANKTPPFQNETPSTKPAPSETFVLSEKRQDRKHPNSKKPFNDEFTYPEENIREFIRLVELDYQKEWDKATEENRIIDKNKLKEIMSKRAGERLI